MIKPLIYLYALIPRRFPPTRYFSLKYFSFHFSCGDLLTSTNTNLVRFRWVHCFITMLTRLFLTGSSSATQADPKFKTSLPALGFWMMGLQACTPKPSLSYALNRMLLLVIFCLKISFKIVGTYKNKTINSYIVFHHLASEYHISVPDANGNDISPFLNPCYFCTC